MLLMDSRADTANHALMDLARSNNITPYLNGLLTMLNHGLAN